VNSFTGHTLDIEAVGTVCRNHGVLFVLNGSQAVGARDLNVKNRPIDALSCCGSKWLLGPYGTGFCWIRPDILASLQCRQAYWLTMQGDRSLDQMRDYKVRQDLGAAAFDVFGTANFMNFLPWAASVEYLLKQGIKKIENYDQNLVSRMIKGLDRKKYRLVSPEEGASRSTLVLLSHLDSGCNKGLYYKLKTKKIDISLREGNLRISPHLYNTPVQIDRLLEVMNVF
jgi:selenocysteine lyase/cysteine desulfurase